MLEAIQKSELDRVNINLLYEQVVSAKRDVEITLGLWEKERDESSQEIERLRRDCSELYQVIGTMAAHCPNPHDPAIVKALDNASAAVSGAPRPHDNLLPFALLALGETAPGKEE